MNDSVFDYMDWRGDISFLNAPFNEVDALIFSIFSYLDFSFISKNRALPLWKAAKILPGLPDEIRLNGPPFLMKPGISLLEKAAVSERFRNVRIMFFCKRTDESKGIQFAAVTFILPDKTGVIAFRGTDTSLVGWKEDMDMSFVSGIPSQLAAAQYTGRVLAKCRIPFRLVGHSKGGNLAIWAASQMGPEGRKYVKAVYGNDAPGFTEEFLHSEGYQEVRERIHSFVPEASIIGVLLSHDGFRTIDSSGTSLFQHDPFSWRVRGRGFIYNASRNISSRQMARVINSWIKAMTPKEREDLIKGIYDLLSSSDAKTLEDLDKKKIRSLFSMQKTFREMGIKKQAQLTLSLAKLFFNSDTLTNSNPFTLREKNQSGSQD